MTVDDREAVREYLARSDWGRYSRDDEAQVAAICERMAVLRTEYTDGDYPAPFHGYEESGACTECDALRVLDLLDD